jgi:hypothetical protein
MTTKYALEPSQEYVKIFLEKACRAAMARADQNPHSLILGAFFLRAVLALPYTVEQISVELCWIVDYGQSWAQKTIRIGDEMIIIETTEAADSGRGWDSETHLNWKVDTIHSSCMDEQELEYLLSAFLNQVSYHGHKVYFYTDYDLELPDMTEHPDPTPWRLAFFDDDAD